MWPRDHEARFENVDTILEGAVMGIREDRSTPCYLRPHHRDQHRQSRAWSNHTSIEFRNVGVARARRVIDAPALGLAFSIHLTACHFSSSSDESSSNRNPYGGGRFTERNSKTASSNIAPMSQCARRRHWTSCSWTMETLDLRNLPAKPGWDDT